MSFWFPYPLHAHPDQPWEAGKAVATACDLYERATE